MARPLIGIALGGGAARGWAHIGVLKALANAGLENLAQLRATVPYSALEAFETVVHLDHQRRHILDGRHHPDDDAAHVLFRRGRIQVDLLHHLAAENRRNILGARDVEPLEYRRRPQHFAH